MHLQSNSGPVLAPPSLFGGLMSALSQSLDWKSYIQRCKKVYVLIYSIHLSFQSEEDGAWPRCWKITAPNQTAMTLEETGKPLLCAKRKPNPKHSTFRAGRLPIQQKCRISAHRRGQTTSVATCMVGLGMSHKTNIVRLRETTKTYLFQNNLLTKNTSNFK